MYREPERQADFVVIGSGVAGLRAAIGLGGAGADVLLLTKDAPSDSTTGRAQGGVAVVLSDEDEIGLHFEDTLRAGAGISEAAAARLLVEEGPRVIVELIGWGAEFDRQGFRLAFGREAAHSARRVLHAGGDATGREIVRALLAKTSAYPSIRIVPGCVARDLRISEGACTGVSYLDEARGECVTVAAGGVLLATGGAGRVYRENTNPPQATGDGVAMAWLAGAELMDMEFVQFHPTALFLPGRPRSLLTEALRGDGGVLRDLRGRRFMVDLHPDAELAPRDVVSRGIVLELERSGDDHVLLDLTHLDASYLRDRFPGVDSVCRGYGLDFTREPIPVLPAAHYFMGGVRTDLDGRTSLNRLYAAGEVACTGVHGANRLASNSLLEGLVFGARVATSMLADRTAGRRVREGHDAGAPAFPDDRADAIASSVAGLAWERLGVIRDGRSLAAAADELSRLDEGDRGGGTAGRKGIEARNRWIVARAIAEAAAWRLESRGAHHRTDHPATDDSRFRVHSVQRRGAEPRGVPVGRGPIAPARDVSESA